VALSADSAGKAVEAATVTGTGSDLSLKLDYATKAAGAYPIVLVTYEIACQKGTPADKLPLVKGFLTYTSGAEGQKILTAQGYAPLPDSIRTKVASAVDGLS
jgi:phosphate transport system substrate-binding protein